MKKLMIMLAAVVMAAGVQAASCTWQTTALTADMTATIDSGSYWLVALGNDSGASADFTVYSDGTVDFGNYAATKGSMTDGGSVGGTIDSLTSANNGNYYALVIWDGNENGYFGVAEGMVSGIVDAPPTDANVISFDNSGMGGVMLTDKAVTTAAVPEPTSGLLMLVGLAGLALRRRRA